jgi:hypothetical protein
MPIILSAYRYFRKERRFFVVTGMGDFSTERLGGTSSISDALGRQPDPRDNAKPPNKRAVPRTNPNPTPVPNAAPDTEESNHELDELA